MRVLNVLKKHVFKYLKKNVKNIRNDGEVWYSIVILIRQPLTCVYQYLSTIIF